MGFFKALKLKMFGAPKVKGLSNTIERAATGRAAVTAGTKKYIDVGTPPAINEHGFTPGSKIPSYGSSLQEARARRWATNKG